MKKVLFMFALIAALLVGSMSTAGAQVTYTVYDGTNTNNFVPVYGFYADNYLKSEYVIPADHLTAINGSTISALTYYLTTSPSAAWTSNFQVFVKEVESASLLSFSGMDDATVVYEGTLDASSGTMVVNFTTPYQYNGGNLLIGFYSTTTGNYSSSTYIGTTITNSSVQGYNGSSAASITASQRDFIPKTTFTVNELHGCITPTNLAVSNITANGATVSWTPGNTETAWTVKFNDIEFNATSSTYTATGLSANTAYVVTVKSVCSATEESDYSMGVSFRTACDAISTNSYTEDFTDYTATSYTSSSTGVQPNCWDFIFTGSNTNYYPHVYNGTYAPTASDNCLVIPAGGTSYGATNYAILPAINNLSDLQLTFATAMSSASALNVALGYMTDASDASTFTSLATIPNNYYSSNRYASHEFALGSYAIPAGARLAIQCAYPSASSYSSAYLCIDDVVVEVAPTCLKPTAVTVSNITTNSAEIAWTNGGTETEWTIDYNGTEVVANSNPYTLTGLTDGTDYTVMVRANCSATDTSAWSTATNFTTPCETFNVTATTPYQQHFDGTNFPPTCWSRVHTVGTSSNQWIGNTTISTYIYAGTGSAQLQDQASGNINDLISGKINIPEANEYQVTFYMHRSSSYTSKLNEGVKVWVNTTPDTVGGTEIAYIHRVYTLSPAESAAGWYQYTATIPNSGDMYVIFQGISEYGAASYIDEVSVEIVPSCLKPTDITISNITTNSAEIAWTNGGTETEWTIDYNGTEVVANSNPYTLTGLADGTDYTVMVRANCSATDTSEWSTAATFATECLANTTFPYTEDFEAVTFPPTCWSQSRTNAGTGTYGTDYPDGAWAHSTSTYSGNATGKAQLRDSRAGSIHALVTGGQDFSYSGGYVLSVDVLRNGYSSAATEGIRIYVNSEPVVDENATELAFISRYYGVASTVNANIVGVESTSAWYTYELPITATGVNYIIFQGESQYSSSTYMDNVIISEAPACQKPTAVTISNITTNSADIAWTNGGNETEWTINYNGTEVVANSNPYTLTGLTSSTDYTVMVRANCSSTDTSEWSNAATFTTECDAYTITESNPYEESFEGGNASSSASTSNGLATCWSAIYNGTTAGYAPHNYYGYYGVNGSSDTCLLIISGSSASYGNNNVVALPEFTNALTDLQLNFSAKVENSSAYLTIGYVSNSVYTAMDSVPVTTTAGAFEYMLNGWTSVPTGAKLAFCFDGSEAYSWYYCAIDDVVVSLIPSCRKPTNITVSNITTNSAEIAWTSNGDETEWLISYNGTEVAANTNPFTLTGLNASTVYTVMVKAVCSATDSSDWSSTEFMTECDVVVVTEANPFVESFENSDFGCWTVDADDDYYTWDISTDIYYEDPADGTQAAEFEGGTYDETTARLISPVLDLTQITDATLTFAQMHADWGGDQNVLNVYYRTDAAAEWTMLLHDSTSIDMWQYDTIILPNATATYQIAFEGVAHYGHSIGIDAVTVSGLDIVVEDTCDTPTNVIVEGNTITWSSEAANFNVMYIVGSDTTTMEVADTTYTFEGLEDSTTVIVMVQAICDSTNVSEWTEGVEFVYTTTGINNYSLNANVYPNPAHDVVNVECSTIGANLSVYDMFGKVVMTATIQSERTELNFSNVAPGVYVIRIADDTASTNVKVVKK